MGKIAAYCMTAFLIALAVIIATNNYRTAEFRLWPFEWVLSVPLAVLILGSFSIGLVAGAGAMVVPLIRAAWERRGLRATIRKMEKAANAAGAAAEKTDGGDMMRDRLPGN